MRPRSLYLILFSAGALVIGILLFARSRQRGPHRPENTVNALAAAQPAPSEGNSAIASTVQASLARLDAILVSRDARPNEATLTFKDDAAYRRFLARDLCDANSPEFGATNVAIRCSTDVRGR
jgi:hypothetical protein